MPDHTFKIIVAGPSSTGKTCLVSRFAEGTFPLKSEPTVGLDLKTRSLQLDGLNVRLNIWDTAGQERYRSVVDMHYRGMHGCLGVFDITNYSTFADLKQEMENIRELYEIEGEKIVIVGNKSDMEAERQVRMNEIIDFTSWMKSTYVETSAKENRNVDEAFLRLVRNILDICESTRSHEGRPMKRKESEGKIEIQRKKSLLEKGRSESTRKCHSSSSTCC